MDEYKSVDEIIESVAKVGVDVVGSFQDGGHVLDEDLLLVGRDDQGSDS